MSTKIRLTTMLSHFEYEKEFDAAIHSIESTGKQIQVYDVVTRAVVYGVPAYATIVEYINEDKEKEKGEGDHEN